MGTYKDLDDEGVLACAPESLVDADALLPSELMDAGKFRQAHA
jgi:hypothetical protein